MHPPTFAELSAAIQRLSTDEKLALAGELVTRALAETHPSHETAWRAEVARRREEVRSGQVRLVPAEEVRASLDRLLG